MGKKLKEIVENSNDLYMINIIKPNGKEKYNRSLWKYEMVDPRWVDDSFKDYKFKPVFLRRGDSFFLAYKSDDSNAYFVDVRKTIHRKSIGTYVNNLIEYSVKSNDVSTTKDEPSFRVSSNEMKKKGIDNFLDFCYTYRDYSAVGTGYTRNVRNLVVMDIDVDCTKPDNRDEIHKLLLLFAKYDSLPDFYIFNHKSKHIQLQWLIQSFNYKNISEETKNIVINELKNDPNKNKEVDFRKTDFTEISQLGIQYRKYTLALCEIVPNRRKFGDRNYTFWKAKNPMAALMGSYDLELLMPYYKDGEIQYRTQEEMNCLFSSKESRRHYFDNAPDIYEWYSKLSERLDPLVGKITEKKAMKNEDAKDVSDIKQDERIRPKMKDDDSFGTSRNTFVVKYTRFITLELSKKYGYRHKEDFDKLPHELFGALKNEALSIVRTKFKEENEKYNGVWPETTNLSSFTNAEFKRAFDSAFTYAVHNINNFSYTNEDREKSIHSRHNSKSLKLIAVDKIRQKNTKITRKELLKEVNTYLQTLYVKKISMGSLKRYIAESNGLTDEERTILYNNLNDRKKYIDSKKS